MQFVFLAYLVLVSCAATPPPPPITLQVLHHYDDVNYRRWFDDAVLNFTTTAGFPAIAVNVTWYDLLLPTNSNALLFQESRRRLRDGSVDVVILDVIGSETLSTTSVTFTWHPKRSSTLGISSTIDSTVRSRQRLF